MIDYSIIGYIAKTHGVNGEMNVTLTAEDLYQDFVPDSCLFFCIDGIYVPFFIKGIRPRGSMSMLLTLDGIDTQEKAAEYVGKAIYMQMYDVEEIEIEPDNMYADDFIGFLAYNGKELLGKIVELDTCTENVLFVVENQETGDRYLIPAVGEFISNFDLDPRQVFFDLPDGILDL